MFGLGWNGAGNLTMFRPDGTSAEMDNQLNEVQITAHRGGIGQPSVVEGIAPVWGSARSSADHFQHGEWAQGTFQAGMAVSDLFLVKSIATADIKLSAGLIARSSAEVAKKEAYRAASNSVRSALTERVGNQSYTEVGYQFQKHLGRNSAWSAGIESGSKLNPTTFNQAGYEAFKEIWRAPRSFKNVGGFLEKRLADGRGIRLQRNCQFKGFLE